jgi:hypothetical protein
VNAIVTNTSTSASLAMTPASSAKVTSQGISREPARDPRIVRGKHPRKRPAASAMSLPDSSLGLSSTPHPSRRGSHSSVIFPIRACLIFNSKSTLPRFIPPSTFREPCTRQLARGIP